MQQYSDACMTKLISTGGPMAICYQLYTEDNVATWKQVSVPTYGHSGVLLIPVKRMPHPDQVDPAAIAWPGIKQAGGHNGSGDEGSDKGVGRPKTQAHPL